MNMDLTLNCPKKYSVMTVGKLWRPQDSPSKNVENTTILKLQQAGLQQLSGMVDKWRNERKIILENKEQQRRKAFVKRENIVKKMKQKHNEKLESRKKMEIALQNTVKSNESSDFLLEQLDYYDLEGHRILNLKNRDQDYDARFPVSAHLFSQPTSYLSSVLSASSTEQMDSKKGTTAEVRTSSNVPQNSRKLNNNNNIQYPEYFINKAAIEKAFIRLKKQHESDSEGPTGLANQNKNHLKESYMDLRELYDIEMQTINTKGTNVHNLQFTYRKFPSFPQNIEELESPSNDPLIIFREWCHFHKLTPGSLKKINVQTLLRDYSNFKANDNVRLTSLCTLINFYSEFQSLINNNETNQHHFSVGQESYISLKEQYDKIEFYLQKGLHETSGKLKLGTALALTLIGKSSENKGIIRNTLMQAVVGITTTEKKIASLAMAYAGMFEHAPFHLILEEWKTADQNHVLQRYLTGLRWLSLREACVIKSVADNLTSDDMYIRLHTCLTLPFLEGNMPASLQYALRQMMCNENAHFLRHAAARVLEAKGQGDCVHAHIITTLSSANILRALEVIQLSLMLKRTDRRIAGVLLPCLQSDMTAVKMIALSVIEKLQVTDPMFVSAVSQLTNDPEIEVREAAFNTLSMMGSELSEVEPIILSSLEQEDDERVRKAMLKVIGNGGIKGRQIEKVLQKVLRKTQSKDDQQMLMEALQNLKLESDDLTSEQSSLNLSESHMPSGTLDSSSRLSESSIETLKQTEEPGVFAFTKPSNNRKINFQLESQTKMHDQNLGPQVNLHKNKKELQVRIRSISGKRKQNKSQSRNKQGKP